MEPVKLPRMSRAEIDELVNSQIICRIALKGQDYPYLAPFRFVKIGDNLYFHFTNYGRKMQLLMDERNACVQIEQYEPDLSSYRFVSFRGRLDEVTDEDEYNNVVKLFAESGSKRLSPKFLAAHGLRPEDGWGSFNTSQKFTIMKLVEVRDKVGLKSP